MKRAFVLSLVLHLAVLSGALWWWSGRDKPRLVSARVSTVGVPAALSDSPKGKPSPAQKTSDLPSEVVVPSSAPSGHPEPVPESEALPLAMTPAVLEDPTSTAAPVFVPASVAAEIKPAYPREARRRNWEGVVEVLVEVDVGGQWRAGRVTTSSGHTLLDEAALQALKAADFRPATRDGAPEPGTLTVRVVFVLKN